MNSHLNPFQRLSKNLDLPRRHFPWTVGSGGQPLLGKVPHFSPILGGSSLRSFAISDTQASSFKKQTP